MSRKQSSKAFYVLLKRAGDTPEAQDGVAQKMVELAKEIPGKMTPRNIANVALSQSLNANLVHKWIRV